MCSFSFFFFSSHFYFSVLFFAAQQSFAFPREGRDFLLLFLYLSWSGDDARASASPPLPSPPSRTHFLSRTKVLPRDPGTESRAPLPSLHTKSVSLVFYTYTDRWEIIVFYLFSSHSPPSLYSIFHLILLYGYYITRSRSERAYKLSLTQRNGILWRTTTTG